MPIFINNVSPQGMIIDPVGEKEKAAILEESAALTQRVEQGAWLPPVASSSLEFQEWRQRFVCRATQSLPAEFAAKTSESSYLN